MEAQDHAPAVSPPAAGTPASPGAVSQPENPFETSFQQDIGTSPQAEPSAHPQPSPDDDGDLATAKPSPQEEEDTPAAKPTAIPALPKIDSAAGYGNLADMTGEGLPKMGGSRVSSSYSTSSDLQLGSGMSASSTAGPSDRVFPIRSVVRVDNSQPGPWALPRTTGDHEPSARPDVTWNG
ncbi:hypothetical protein Micbo1qcDRAFT_169629, partial [Microdochium bolleyi]